MDEKEILSEAIGKLEALGNGWTAEVIIHILKHALDKTAR